MNIDINLDNISDNNLDNNLNNDTTDKKNKSIKKIIIYILFSLLIVSLIIIYARYKATSGIKVNEYKITSSLITDNFHGVKVVHFSDIHYGNTVDIDYLKEIVNEINELDGDIVVFTGDLLSDNIDVNEKNSITTILSGINANIGKYAISGESDHDSLFNEIITDSGFVNVSDNQEIIYYKNGNPIIISNKDELSDSNLYSIFLLHKPDDIDKLNNHFNLVLSGHSHNGQINIPYIKKLLLPDGAKKYFENYYRINDTDLFVSSGIGTNDFKFRFLNKPSINLYRLTKY